MIDCTRSTNTIDTRLKKAFRGNLNPNCHTLFDMAIIVVRRSEKPRNFKTFTFRLRLTYMSRSPKTDYIHLWIKLEFTGQFFLWILQHFYILSCVISFEDGFTTHKPNAKVTQSELEYELAAQVTVVQLLAPQNFLFSLVSRFSQGNNAHITRMPLARLWSVGQRSVVRMLKPDTFDENICTKQN